MPPIIFPWIPQKTTIFPTVSPWTSDPPRVRETHRFFDLYLPGIQLPGNKAKTRSLAQRLVIFGKKHREEMGNSP
jgi:hypothetical protein